MNLDLPIEDFPATTRAFQLVQPYVVPVGTIVRYAGSVAPTGWLLCNGASYSRVRYPVLSRIIGGSGDTFTLPSISDTSIVKT